MPRVTSKWELTSCHGIVQTWITFENASILEWHVQHLV